MTESGPPTQRRGTGWLLTVLGGATGSAAGLATLATLVSTALDGSGSSSPTTGYLVALALLGVSVVLAAVGARVLGVRSVLGRAGFAALVATAGFVLLWVAAIVVGRLTS